MAPKCTASARRCCLLWVHRGGCPPFPSLKPCNRALAAVSCTLLCRESSPCRRADLLRRAGAHLGAKAPSRARAQPQRAAGFLCHPQESGCPSGSLRLYTQPHRELSIPGCLSAVFWPCQGEALGDAEPLTLAARTEVVALIPAPKSIPGSWAAAPRALPLAFCLQLEPRLVLPFPAGQFGRECAGEIRGWWGASGRGRQLARAPAIARRSCIRRGDICCSGSASCQLFLRKGLRLCLASPCARSRGLPVSQPPALPLPWPSLLLG